MTLQGPSFRFPKKEKLTGKKEIEELFKYGSSFYLPPLMVRFRPDPNPDDHPYRALFAVSKKNFKRAVKRNLIKRRMKEAYRLHKFLLFQNKDLPVYQMAFVYLDKKILPYTEIEDKLKQLIHRLNSSPSIRKELKE